MFRNKFLLIFAILAFAGVVFYSLKDSSIETFEEKTTKERAEYENSILNDSQNIILDKANFKGFQFFMPDEKFLIEADFQEVSSENSMILMTDSSSIEMKKIGNASFEIEGKKAIISIFDEGQSFMLPFRDLTNKTETYGGGRYINIPKESLKSGKIEIDFNKSHNFYCAYNENFICPVPPKENFIAIEIRAGEKKFIK